MQFVLFNMVLCVVTSFLFVLTVFFNDGTFLYTLVSKTSDDLFYLNRGNYLSPCCIPILKHDFCFSDPICQSCRFLMCLEFHDVGIAYHKLFVVFDAHIHICNMYIYIHILYIYMCVFPSLIASQGDFGLH